MPEPSALAAVNRPLALALRALTRRLLRPPVQLFAGFRVEGAERLPRARRKLVLACNHAAFVDSVYLILALRPRFTICGAKPRLFRNRGLRGLMALANILKVESREQFHADCGALLAAGEILLIYPEMGRNPGGLGEFQEWAAAVALAAAAPILPCYLHGTSRGDRGAVRLYVGEEIEPAGDPSRLTARLRRAIAELAPAAAEPKAEAP
ncbi:MAG: lysophospholipid acyltransferase family protein [Thermoanaerobaculia bacterium]